MNRDAEDLLMFELLLIRRSLSSFLSSDPSLLTVSTLLDSMRDLHAGIGRTVDRYNRGEVNDTED